MRLEDTGVSAGIHASILTYEANLLAKYVDDSPKMSGFSKAVNLAVAQYLLDRIEIITKENE